MIQTLFPSVLHQQGVHLRHSRQQRHTIAERLMQSGGGKPGFEPNRRTRKTGGSDNRRQTKHMGDRQHTIDQVIRRHIAQGCRCLSAKPHIVMGQHHPLGVTGCAGSIKQHRNIRQIRIRLRERRCGDVQSPIRPGMFNRAKSRRMRPRILGNAGRHNHRRRPCMIEDAFDFGFGLARVDGDDDRIQFPAPEKNGNRCRTILGQHQNPVVFPDPGVAQHCHNRITCHVQPGITPACPDAVAQRRCIWARPNLICQKSFCTSHIATPVSHDAPVAAHAIRGHPNSGLRFSRKAAIPSAASSRPAAAAIASRSASS